MSTQNDNLLQSKYPELDQNVQSKQLLTSNYITGIVFFVIGILFSMILFFIIFLIFKDRLISKTFSFIIPAITSLSKDQISNLSYNFLKYQSDIVSYQLDHIPQLPWTCRDDTNGYLDCWKYATKYSSILISDILNENQKTVTLSTNSNDKDKYLEYFNLPQSIHRENVEYLTIELPSGPEVICSIYPIPDQKTCWIIFKGSTSESDMEYDFTITNKPLREWIFPNGINIDEINIPDLPNNYNNDVSIQNNSFSRNRYKMVNEGVLNLWTLIREKVWNTFDLAVKKSFSSLTTSQPKIPLLNLWIAGHSLGGALAQMAAIEARYGVLNQKSIYISNMLQILIAPIRVGSPEFVSWQLKLFNNEIFLLVNLDDIAPFWPLPVVPQKNNKAIAYGILPSATTFAFNTGQLLLNHLLPIYLKNLDQIQYF